MGTYVKCCWESEGPGENMLWGRRPQGFRSACSSCQNSGRGRHLGHVPKEDLSPHRHRNPIFQARVVPPTSLSLGDLTSESKPCRATGECRHITIVLLCTGPERVKKPSSLRPGQRHYQQWKARAPNA